MTDSVNRERHPVVLFDGVCNLCSGTVQALIRRDPHATLRFASLQSPPGQSLLEQCEYTDNTLEGIVLVDDSGCYRKSAAVLRIATHLGWPYRLLAPFHYVPRPLRDWGYDFIANRRYRWFGTRDACMMPSPDSTSRFLDDGIYPPPDADDAPTNR